jgi:hypothetical protein
MQFSKWLRLKRKQNNTNRFYFVVSFTILAGDKSLSWHSLIEDFILVGQKLEKLGFTYCRGRVINIDPSWEDMKYV